MVVAEDRKSVDKWMLGSIPRLRDGIKDAPYDLVNKEKLSEVARRVENRRENYE